jgi:hypothetical protein
MLAEELYIDGHRDSSLKNGSERRPHLCVIPSD